MSKYEILDKDGDSVAYDHVDLPAGSTVQDYVLAMFSWFYTEENKS